MSYCAGLHLDSWLLGLRTGYYWVPGIWVLAPQPGLLWTPGYWGWADGIYVWHDGYWGRHVGFYGGVCYGYGYTGVGFYGGYWRSGVYYYNRSVTNVNVTAVRTTYSRAVVNNTVPSRISYNGGTAGILAKPTAKELVAAREKHLPATAFIQAGLSSLLIPALPGAFISTLLSIHHQCSIFEGNGTAIVFVDRPQ